MRWSCRDETPQLTDAEWVINFVPPLLLRDQLPEAGGHMSLRVQFGNLCLVGESESIHPVGENSGSHLQPVRRYSASKRIKIYSTSSCCFWVTSASMVVVPGSAN